MRRAEPLPARMMQALRESPARPVPGICTAALSGGADSTALLLCLHELQNELGISLRAVHVHHGIRGAEADRDAAFCQALCECLSVPLTVVKADVPAYAKEYRLSLETAARILRYEALKNAAPEGDIATAHHAGDNAETVLFHLMRGAGLNGLCGIPARNGRIIRPLLFASRADILAFLAESGQGYTEDSTNTALDTSRNRIRHIIFPAMQAENPQAEAHISRTAAMLSEDEAYLTAQADAAYRECLLPSGGVKRLSAYSKPIRMRVYLRMVADCTADGAPHFDPSFAMLNAIDALVMTEHGGKITLTADTFAEADSGILYLRRDAVRAQTELPLQIGDNAVFSDKICTAKLEAADALSRSCHKPDTRSTLDFDKIIGTPRFRKIAGNDKIRLPGRGFDSTLKKLVQANVPGPERSRVCALFDDLGCIYCEGAGIAARVKPDADTCRLLLLSCRSTAGSSVNKAQSQKT